MNLCAKYISTGRVSPRTRFDTEARTQERVYFRLRKLKKKHKQKDKKVIKIKQKQENKTKKEKSSYLQPSVLIDCMAIL